MKIYEDFSRLSNECRKMEENQYKSEIYPNVPDFCFEESNTDVYRVLFKNKPIYIFENHAAALKAWKETAKESPIDLITFDEHTDTHPPLWCYASNIYEKDQKKLVRLLNALKSNFSDNIMHGLYKRKMLRNDEHITMAIYMNIIKKAYVYAVDSYNRPNLHPTIEKIYDSIQFIESHPAHAFSKYPKAFRECTYIDDLLELEDKYLSNLDNNTIDELMNKISPSDDYVLDIDLDYFQSPFILDNNYFYLESFCTLIGKAKAITIATETNWVSTQVKKYTSLYEQIDEKCKKLSTINPFRKSWDSRQLLQYILGLIEYVLSGTWEKDKEKRKQHNDEIEKMMTYIETNTEPLVSEDSAQPY